MDHKTSGFSRRGFMRAFAATGGACSLGLPFLSQLVRAENETSARRLIIFSSPNEPIERALWQPQGGNGNNYAITGLNAPFKPIGPYKEKLLFLGDLEMKSRLDDPKVGGHVGFSHALTGRRVVSTGSNEPQHWGGGISVDQYIAEQRGTSALTLGARVLKNNGLYRLSYTGASQPVDPIASPVVAFDKLFGDTTLSAAERAQLRAQRLSVLDRVSGDLTRAKAQLPSEARQKLDRHADMVRSLEHRFAEEADLACSPDAPPEAGNYSSNAMFPTTIRRHVDVAVQALACGVTDVATIQVNSSLGNDITPNWVDEEITLNDSYHNIAHDFNQNPSSESNRDRRMQCERFFSRMFAYLLEQLEAIPEPDGGTMLDTSLVVWLKPLGHHHVTDKMLFMLGGGNGLMPTGRFRSFNGRAHNDLLVNVCNLMGVADEQFGTAKYCSGALTL